jgi:glycosyltransferase involved in cell wall biosynthesis
MRILYLSPIGGLGGAERVLLATIRHVARFGHEALLISCTPGPLLERARDAGATAADVLPMPNLLSSTEESGGAVFGLLRSAATAPLMSDYLRRLALAIRRARPDVVHSNGFKTHALSSLARAGVPVVWHLHDFIRSRPLTSRVLRFIRRRAARAIAVSQAVAHDAAGVLADLPIDVVPNAIDLNRFSPGKGNPAELDRLAGLSPPEGVVRIGLVATYARWKGHDLFLRAAARALATDPGLPVRFCVIGGPIYHTAGSQWSLDELRGRAKSLGIAPKVGFVHFLDDPVPVYRALDVVVHASTQPEPFGLTIAEAMACGRAVLVSNAGGAAELFEDGKDAIGLPPGDEDALARAITQLVHDDDRREQLGTNARAAAQQRFDDSRFGQRLVDVYQRAMR